MSRRLSQTANATTNPAFTLANDDIQPPPYSAIYPFPTNELSSSVASTSKLTLQPTTILVAERRDSGAADVTTTESSGHQDAMATTVQTSLLLPNRHISTASLFQYSQEPMSYEELFHTNNDQTSNLVYANSNNSSVASGGLNRSGHYFYSDNQSSDRSTNLPTPIVLQRRQQVSQLRKQLEMQFPKAYFFKHSIFIILTSITLIIFQIVLMANDAMLSNLSSGIWAGLACLFTVLLSILTCKCTKSTFSPIKMTNSDH